MKQFLRLLLFLGILLAGVAAFFWKDHDALLERGLEQWISKTQKEFFIGPVDFKGLRLHSDFTLSIVSMQGVWQGEEGGFPFEIYGIELTDPLYNFLLSRPVTLRFKKLIPARSEHPGVSGQVILSNDPNETFELKADFLGLYLEDLIPLNHEIFTKASGKLMGSLLVQADKTGTKAIALNMNVSRPGGRLPAYFFDILRPYLPPAEQKIMAQIRALQSVSYETAELRAELAEKDALKILLKIRIPDYNLNLNLNLTIRVEENEAFFELAQLMGLVKVGA